MKIATCTLNVMFASASPIKYLFSFRNFGSLLGTDNNLISGETHLRTRYPANLIQFSDGSRSYEQTDWDTFYKCEADENCLDVVSNTLYYHKG